MRQTYGKFKYFSINAQCGWHEGFCSGFASTDAGLCFNPQQDGVSRTAAYYSTSFDSQMMGNQWHRLRIWAHIPEGMDFMVSVMALDHKYADEEFQDLDWYICDEGISPEQKAAYLEMLWGRWEAKSGNVLLNPRDCLLNEARGRFLWLRIKVSFTCLQEDCDCFCLEKARVYFPRMTFLDYLPAVYQEDPESKEFLERFLSIFSTLHDDMEERIDQMALLFDVDIAAGEYLKWLANWLAIAPDDRWSDESLRRLISRAMEIFRVRGTKQALEEMIEIYTGEKPWIIEHFQYKNLLNNNEYRDTYMNLYGNDPYAFSVLIRAERVSEGYQKMAVKKIIEEEKPAYTEARLVFLKNSIELDNHTYLGLNSVIAGASPLILDSEKSVLYNNILKND